MTPVTTVIANGPSALPFLVDSTVFSKNVIGFSYQSLLQRSYYGFFWEPLPVNNPNSIEHLYSFSSGALNRFLLMNLVARRCAESMDENSSATIYINPQPLVKSDFLINPIHRDVTPLKYFIVNESSDQLILEGLKQYISLLQHHRASPILNLRCSVIRAISLAFLSGSAEIDIVGVDPFMTEYWFTALDENHSLYLRYGTSLQKCFLEYKDVAMLKEFSRLILSSEERTKHEGEWLCGNSLLTYSECICLVLKTFLKLPRFKHVNVVVHTSDSTFALMLKSYKINFRCVSLA